MCAIAFIVSFVIGIIQRSKQKNISKLQALYECIPNAVINAEKLFGEKNGENKKLFVMTTLSNIALQSGTKFDYNELDKRVEDVVKATKHVNTMQCVEETFRTGDDTQSTETSEELSTEEDIKNDSDEPESNSDEEPPKEEDSTKLETEEDIKNYLESFDD